MKLMNPVTGIFAGALLLLMAGCGGGGGGASTTQGGTIASGVLVGTAAIGAPLSAAEITLRDVDGLELTTTTSVEGNFPEINVATLKPPIMIRATANFGGNYTTLFSVVFEAGRVNITPFTDASILLATGINPTELFKDRAMWVTKLTRSGIELAQQRLKEYVAGHLQVFGVPSDYNLFGGVLVANGTGADALSDYLRVNLRVDGSGITIQDKLAAENKVVVARSDSSFGTLMAPTSNTNLLQRVNTILAKLTHAYAGTSAECISRMRALYIGSAAGKSNGHTTDEAINLSCVLNWTTNAGATFTNPVIKYCNGEGNPLGRCSVQRTINLTTGAVSSSDSFYDLSTDSTVYPTGVNQNSSSFWAQIRPAIERIRILDGDHLVDPYNPAQKIASSEVKYPGLLVFLNASGFSNNVNPGDGASAPILIRSAKIFAGINDQGAELGRLNLYPGRNGALLRDTSTQMLMSNILPLNQNQITALRAAGGRVAIYAYTDFEYTALHAAGVYYISSSYPSNDQITDSKFVELSRSSIEYLIAGGLSQPPNSGERLTTVSGSPIPSGGYLLSSMKSFTKLNNDGEGTIEFLPSSAIPGSTTFMNNPQLDATDINGILYRSRYIKCGSANVSTVGCRASGR